jgi:hypothetical protein
LKFVIVATTSLAGTEMLIVEAYCGPPGTWANCTVQFTVALERRGERIAHRLFRRGVDPVRRLVARLDEAGVGGTHFRWAQG